MQVTENNLRAFLDWKAASIPTQRCSHINRTSTGDWGRGQGTCSRGSDTWGDSSSQNPSGPVEGGRDSTWAGTCRNTSAPCQSHPHEDTVLGAQCCPPPSSRLLQTFFEDPNQVVWVCFPGICSLIPCWGTTYFLSLGLNFRLVFLLPHIVSSEEIPSLWLGQK